MRAAGRVDAMLKGLCRSTHRERTYEGRVRINVVVVVVVVVVVSSPSFAVLSCARRVGSDVG
jgi:hypothetical protein